jgi:hypothetical protein
MLRQPHQVENKFGELQMQYHDLNKLAQYVFIDLLVLREKQNFAKKSGFEKHNLPLGI